jgi:transcriptional regulator with XRE-family HTH domain
VVVFLYDVGKCLLSDLLQEKRMSQQELADHLGVTRQQINHYLNPDTHKRRIMTLHIAKNVSKVIGCEMDDLYEWIPVEVRNKRR